MTAIDFEVGQKSVVQIYYADVGNVDSSPNDFRRIAGTGFWMGGRYVMTCAHVVLNILDISEDKDTIGQPVQLLFAQAGQSESVRARVIYCRFNLAVGFEDVAVLRLVDSVDLEHLPIQLSNLFPQMNNPLSMFGYLNGSEEGNTVDAIA